MLLNERIKEIRVHRKLKSKELATCAGLSYAAISLLEKKMRTPRVDTLQKIAAAFEVSTSFLLGEEDSDVPIPTALSKQSLRLFLKQHVLSDIETEWLLRVSGLDSAPQSTKGWKDLLSNLTVR